MIEPYRPWGPLGWMLGKLPNRKWSILGSLSTEDRCVAVLQTVEVPSRASQVFLRILDPDTPVTEPFAQRHAEMQKRMVAAGSPAGAFKDVPLLASFDAMMQTVDAFLAQAGENIILDVTAMPKRWFFPLTKLLVRREQVKSLVITYTSAVTYSETLSSNPEPLSTIPGFATDDARSEHDTAVVGIGFEPLGLDELYSRQRVGKIRYIFPFPPGPPGFHRNWAFVRKLEDPILNRERGHDRRWHISMYDCSSVFDILIGVSAKGTSTCVLAPYGPKTVSLAMCLFANALEQAALPQAPVYYAQPKRYDIAYSAGIKVAGGQPDVQAYCVKLNGRNLYTVD